MATVEVTPLIDVVFLLLIFFMVSTTFIRDAALAVDLPEAEGVRMDREAGDIEVRVGAAGDYAVNGKPLTRNGPQTLLRALRDAQRDTQTASSDARVVVAADAAARHDAVVHVLDAAKRLGLTRIRILTQVRRSPPDEEAEDGGQDSGQDSG